MEENKFPECGCRRLVILKWSFIRLQCVTHLSRPIMVRNICLSRVWLVETNLSRLPRRKLIQANVVKGNTSLRIVDQGNRGNKTLPNAVFGKRSFWVVDKVTHRTWLRLWKDIFTESCKIKSSIRTQLKETCLFRLLLGGQESPKCCLAKLFLQIACR